MADLQLLSYVAFLFQVSFTHADLPSRRETRRALGLGSKNAPLVAQSVYLGDFATGETGTSARKSAGRMKLSQI